MNHRASSKRFIAIAIVLGSIAILLAPHGEAQSDKFPAIISYFSPSIPTVAFTARIEGRVVIELVIGADGVPISARTIEGHPLLQEPTEKAAMRWRFASAREGPRTIRLVFVYPPLTFVNSVSITVLPYHTELKVEPPSYVYPETESHIPVDWRPGEDRCGVHYEILRKDKVKIIYGLMAFRAAYQNAERVLFPNSNVVAYGGCVITTDPVSGQASPRFAEVLYCPRCRFELKKWSHAHRRNRFLA